MAFMLFNLMQKPDPIADEFYMRRALELATHAEQCGEIPVGAVLVQEGQIIAEGFNQSIMLHDPTAHAEIAALRAAGVPVEDLEIGRADLEDVFLNIMQGEAA